MTEQKVTADDVVRRIRRALVVNEAPVIVTGTSGGAGTSSRRDVGFANPMTAAGDLIRGGSSGAATRLGIGTAGQVLTVVSGKPAWATPSGGGGGTVTRDLLTNGDPVNPELIFAGGDVIWIES